MMWPKAGLQCICIQKNLSFKVRVLMCFLTYAPCLYMCCDVLLQIGASYHQTNVSVWVVDLEVGTSVYCIFQYITFFLTSCLKG